MRVLKKSDGVTVLKTLMRPCIILVIITTLIMTSTSYGQRDIRPPLPTVQSLIPVSTEGDDLYQNIRQSVTELEYSNTIAEDFVSMVRNWKTPQGWPALRVLQTMLVRARDASREGQISKSQLGRIEGRVVKALAQYIKKEIAFRRNYFELDAIIETRHANCLGYAQLFCILGNSIGISVSAMNVTKDHVANIVGFSDGTMTVVDLFRTSGLISERLIVDSAFEGDGNHWKYKDRNHITKENITIHILDEKELICEIHFCRGTMQYMSGRGAEAIVHYDRAIELSPKCARAYNNRGGANLMLKNHNEAISDFNKAIDLSPTYINAYHNRANAYLDSEQYDRAITDYTRAIELNPQFAKAYFGRGFAHLALGEYDEAIRDYTQAIQINPDYARAYYTRAIGYAHLEENEKAIQDMLQAVTLDQTLRADVQKASTEFELNLKMN